jgi:hypothetical protein
MSYRTNRDATQPLVNALVASVVALGSGAGKAALSRASHILRNIADDPRTERDTSAILNDITNTIDAME